MEKKAVWKYLFYKTCESTDAFLLSYDADAARAVLWAV